MTYLVAYQRLDTFSLFDPSNFFVSDVLDIGTQYEFRSHTLTDAIDVVGLGMNDLPTAAVQSITLFTGTNITGVSSEQAAAWQATDVGKSSASIFDASFSEFGPALLAGDDVIDGSDDGDNINGFNGDDSIFGRGGADELTGGPGRDTLAGGTGNNRFFFFDALKTANVDRLTDFSHGHDQLRLDRHVFTKLHDGALDPTQFHLGAAAADPNDFIVYNRQTGLLSYDRDGSGTHFHPLPLALLNHAGLTASDIHGFFSF